MSAVEFPTRLYWAGMRGIARANGREVRLVAPPHLPGLQVDALDYIPGQLATLMPKRDGWRNMEQHEIAAAAQLLEQLTKGNQ